MLGPMESAGRTPGSRYTPLFLRVVAVNAVLCAGIPVGHTRPQWVLPHGGNMTVDGAARRVHAHYG